MIENGLYVDKPIVRHSNLQSFTVIVGTPTLIAPASAKRMAITFGSDGGAVVLIGQQNPIDGARAIRIPTAATPVVLDSLQYGSMVQGNWFAVLLAGAAVVWVIDTVQQ